MTHLRTTFSALDLHPVDEAAALSFIMGCFHAASLDYPRPLLFIDSAQQGRGKTEVSKVVSILLDNDSSTLAIAGHNQNVMDDVVAHLLSGCRTISGQNISGAANYNNEFLACLATDGTVKKRGKYDRTATPFHGIVGVLSSVYGQASFHPDLVTRYWRVFLRGRSQRLRPQPWYYARDHRAELIDEIMLAHAAATPYTGALHTRFNQFEAAAAAAYAAYAGLSHDEVSDLIGRMVNGCAALLPGAVGTVPKAAFPQPPHKEVASRIGQQSPQPEELEGARALGLTYSQGDWHDEA